VCYCLSHRVSGQCVLLSVCHCLCYCSVPQGIRSMCVTVPQGIRSMCASVPSALPSLVLPLERGSVVSPRGHGVQLQWSTSSAAALSALRPICGSKLCTEAHMWVLIFEEAGAIAGLHHFCSFGRACSLAWTHSKKWHMHAST